MEIKPQKYRLALVFSSIFYPFVYPEIVDSLKKREYKVFPPPQTAPPFPTGPRIYIGGYLAAKEGCFVEINEDRKVVACEGISIESIIKIIKELIIMAREDFNVNPDADISYSELEGYMFVIDENPIDKIEKVFQTSTYGKFDEVLGSKTTSFTISIVPKGILPSNKKWFNIRIEPRFSMPNNQYFINVVYRDEDTNKVLEFAREIDSKVLSLLKIIGGSV